MLFCENVWCVLVSCRVFGLEMFFIVLLMCDGFRGLSWSCGVMSVVMVVRREVLMDGGFMGF